MVAYPMNRPFDTNTVYARTTSIGATPAAGSTVATKKGTIKRAYALSEGTSSSTITVAISLNGGSSLGSFSFTGGALAVGSTDELNIPVSEGDVITFTPTGGGGSTIPGHFYAVIR